MQLVKYEAACTALAEANAVDEVLEIRNMAEAMKAYARQAKNTELMRHAKEITLRAERKLGEMIIAQKSEHGLNSGNAGKGRPNLGGTFLEPPKETLHSNTDLGGTFLEPPKDIPTLADMGIDKKLSARAQKLAGATDEGFERVVQDHKDGIAAANAKLVNDIEEITKPDPKDVEIAELKGRLDEMCALVKDQSEEMEGIAEALEGNEPLQACHKEIKRLNAKIRVLEERLNGTIGELAEARRLAKSHYNKILKLEKEIKQYQSGCGHEIL